MTLITRIARLFRADLHAVLDRIEEPDVLLRQALREMEEDLERDRKRLEALRREARQLSAREEEIARSAAALEDELSLCFSAGQDSLAKALVKRKLETARAAEALAKKREALETGRSELEARIRDHQARLEQVRLKAEALADAPGDRYGDPTGPDPGLREEDIEVAFLREKQRRAQP